MAGKQAKRKPQAKTRKRKKNVELADLPVAAAGAVKGGDTKTTTATTSTTSQQPYLKVKMTDVIITS